MVARRVREKLGLSGKLRERILAAYPRLPGNQRRVADYLLQHGTDAALLSTGTLAGRLKVSKATLVRFGQRIGFDGFNDLRNELLASLRSGIQDLDRFMLSVGKVRPEETLGLVAGHEMENIQQTISHLDRRTFEQTVQTLLSARRVYAMGIGISSILAQVLAYELNQVAVDARAISGSSLGFIEALALAERRDGVVAFSFPPYSRETVDAAAHAAGRRIPVIAITDRVTSPVSFHAACILAVRSENMLYTNSISAVSVVINALVTEVAAKNKRAVSRTFRRTSEALGNTDQFVS